MSGGAFDEAWAAGHPVGRPVNGKNTVQSIHQKKHPAPEHLIGHRLLQGKFHSTNS